MRTLICAGHAEVLQPQSGDRCTEKSENINGKIQFANNPLSSAHSRHIDVRHHVLRERVFREIQRKVHVYSTLQHVEVLKKPPAEGS